MVDLYNPSANRDQGAREPHSIPMMPENGNELVDFKLLQEAPIGNVYAARNKKSYVTRRHDLDSVKPNPKDSGCYRSTAHSLSVIKAIKFRSHPSMADPELLTDGMFHRRPARETHFAGEFGMKGAACFAPVNRVYATSPRLGYAVIDSTYETPLSGEDAPASREVALATLKCTTAAVKIMDHNDVVHRDLKLENCYCADAYDVMQGPSSRQITAMVNDYGTMSMSARWKVRKIKAKLEDLADTANFKAILKKPLRGNENWTACTAAHVNDEAARPAAVSPKCHTGTEGELVMPMVIVMALFFTLSMTVWICIKKMSVKLKNRPLTLPTTLCSL